MSLITQISPPANTDFKGISVLDSAFVAEATTSWESAERRLDGRPCLRESGRMAGTVAEAIGWLLEGDASIRWQVMKDLLDAPSGQVEVERSRVAQSGWGARLLERQGPEGRWAGWYSPKWTSATYTLLLLRTCGLPQRNPEAVRAALMLLAEGLHEDKGINFWKRLSRKSETCVSAIVLAIAAWFLPADPRIEGLAEYLLTQQMPDGGWNCRRDYGATHSSLHTTILALEGLLAYEVFGGLQTAATKAARERGHEFLLVHRLFRSHRTGEVIDPRMTRFAFPPHWHYDVLRGLDYLQAARVMRDPRLEEAIVLLKSRRTTEGRWLLQNHHRGRYHFMMEEPGQPSRWNTLRALRVLKWWGDSAL